MTSPNAGAYDKGLPSVVAREIESVMDVAKVAIVGLGTIGSGVARLLLESTDRISRHAGRRVMLARVVGIAREDNNPEALVFVAGAASALLKHLESRDLWETPQIAEAVGWLADLGAEGTAEWLEGQTATRAAAVAAARGLITTRG